MYAIRITFADEKNSAFVELGGAPWATRKEQLVAMEPDTSRGPSQHLFSARQARQNGIDVEDTKCILAETVEALLGEPITLLIARGRQKAA
jgi:hypothetical protein